MSSCWQMAFFSRPETVGSITEFAILIFLTFSGTFLEASIINCSRDNFTGSGLHLWVNKAVFCLSFCLFCHFTVFLAVPQVKMHKICCAVVHSSPFCDETFQRNPNWGKNMFPEEMENLNMYALFMSTKFLWLYKKKIKLIPSAPVPLILFCFLQYDWLFSIAGVFSSFSDRIRVFLEVRGK